MTVHPTVADVPILGIDAERRVDAVSKLAHLTSAVCVAVNVGHALVRLYERWGDARQCLHVDAAGAVFCRRRFVEADADLRFPRGKCLAVWKRFEYDDPADDALVFRGTDARDLSIGRAVELDRQDRDEGPLQGNPVPVLLVSEVRDGGENIVLTLAVERIAPDSPHAIEDRLHGLEILAVLVVVR
ncbi:MAG: hypothetical protein CO030_01115 [Candidatus Magasanikbacteria bacterium CG_4_9_14_0_2_um_filter_42_11]|uniref:Uncharacterized protein n=1 Tax=Candidatus Magasanikbacteria bacterium CG_4_9_14_0_2_um_filter_42_11 TaxID=1974643 RepID=A0A2M8FAP1_9BACT|nr:MAG: hypothetical protein COU34_02835 [Candidatus Magasanikbacteria bacterium CG10_big_fil_rev_8_21_14_0_10_43_9]PIY92482.1 MAG: hypothetical protein COY70_03010 [Candidatus Magasanikbacteria bacterium CG_4_10_14_0_8_um_filter_42_12]PJC52781.1 MAG: hypothetical protein CO030_01115 [Candidatus Magasanikbacteria bacterium CG_4_9_14_0_2_um_filter_42_11]